MAKNKISEYSTTALSNSDVGGIGILGTNIPENFDNALREVMKQIADLNTGASFIHDTYKIADSDAETKLAKFDAGSITAGQTRTFTFPDADGTIALDSGPMGGFRNKIINGDFDIWQRATSQTLNDYGSVDRWRVASSGSTKTFSQQTFTLGQTDVIGNPTYYSRNVTSSVAGAGNFSILSQRIENVKTLSGKTATLTFYAKADAAKNMAVELLQSFGTGGSPSADVDGIGSQLVALTTSWQKFSVTITIPSISGKTLGSGGNDSLQVFFWFDAGSTYNSRTASLGQQSGTFDIAHVSIVEGDATSENDPFSTRHIGQEIKLCQRYYEKSYDIDVVPGSVSNNGVIWAFGSCDSAGSTGCPLRFAVRKRVTPTMSFYEKSAGTSTWHYTVNGSSSGTTTPSTGGIAGESGVLVYSGTIGSAGDAATFTGHYTADAEL